MKLSFARKKMTKLIDFLCETEFRYGRNEFRSCKIDSLFGKVDLHVGDFQFCSGGIDINFGQTDIGKVELGTSAFECNVCRFVNQKSKNE